MADRTVASYSANLAIGAERARSGDKADSSAAHLRGASRGDAVRPPAICSATPLPLLRERSVAPPVGTSLGRGLKWNIAASNTPLCKASDLIPGDGRFTLTKGPLNRGRPRHGGGCHEQRRVADRRGVETQEGNPGCPPAKCSNSRSPVSASNLPLGVSGAPKLIFHLSGTKPRLLRSGVGALEAGGNCGGRSSFHFGR